LTLRGVAGWVLRLFLLRGEMALDAKKSHRNGY